MGRRRKVPTVQPDPIRTIHGAFATATLDLHGLYANPAMTRVKGFVMGWAEREPGVILRIVTGKGTHSDGEPVIRSRFLALLAGDLAPWIDDWASEVGGGSYLIRVRSKGSVT